MKSQNIHTFSHICEYDTQPRVEMSIATDAETLAGVLEVMERYLVGCGYYVKTGSLTCEPLPEKEK